MKKVGYGLIAVLSLLGVLLVWNAGWQAKEDYQNFRKIVVWVAQKQAQEAEYARRQQQQAAAKAAQPPATVPQ